MWVLSGLLAEHWKPPAQVPIVCPALQDKNLPNGLWVTKMSLFLQSYSVIVFSHFYYCYYHRSLNQKRLAEPGSKGSSIFSVAFV